LRRNTNRGSTNGKNGKTTLSDPYILISFETGLNHQM
jgi:hypothetical protein